MEQQPTEAVQPRSGWLIALSVLAYIVVALAIAAELLVLDLLMTHKATPHGESRAFQGMAVIYVVVISLWIVVPGTLIAFGRAVYALVRWRRRRAPWSLAFHSVAFALPFAVFAYLLTVG